jgi:uncharacterized protein (TIGR00369 family)
MMSKLNPKHVEAVIDLINQGPFFRLLSMQVKDLGKGYSLVEMDVGNEHLNPFGGLHGGAYASVIDTAAYWSVYCEVEENVGLISLDLKVDFLAPANVGKMFVKGRCIKMGKTICLAEATAFDQQEKWLAHGLSKMMVLQGPQTIGEAANFIGSTSLPPKFVKHENRAQN